MSVSPSLVNAYADLERVATQPVSNAYYYTHEDLRVLLLKELRDHHLSTEALCIQLALSYDMIYKIRKGTRHIPSSILDRLGMYKVCDRQYILGYVSIGHDIEWQGLWRGLEKESHESPRELDSHFHRETTHE